MQKFLSWKEECLRKDGIMSKEVAIAVADLARGVKGRSTEMRAYEPGA